MQVPCRGTWSIVLRKWLLRKIGDVDSDHIMWIMLRGWLLDKIGFSNKKGGKNGKGAVRRNI